MKKSLSILVLFGLAAALILSACSLSLAGDVTPPPGYQPPVYEDPAVLTGAAPEAEPNPANGQAIYQEKCQACHGDTGLGDGPDSTGLPNPVAAIGAPSAANLASPLEWYSIILQGNIERFMPPFSGSLSDSDVWDVLAYVYTFSADQEAVSQGAQVFENTCASCHGPDGSGSGMPGAANLLDADQMVLLSVNDIIQKIATGSGNEGHVFSTELDAAQIESAALYVRSLIFPLEGGEVVQQATPEPTAAPAEGEDADTEGDGEAVPAPTEIDAADDGLGTITGVVVNGSGGDLPDDLEVRLEVYESFELIYEDSVAAETDGSYTFEDVEINPELIYITLVETNGAFFPSAFHMGAETVGETIDLPITIYDTTTDTSNLVVSRLHIFFEFSQQGTVQVIYQVTIDNRGSEMVAPPSESEPVLEFSLPEDATNLIFQTGTIGNPYVRTAGGFADPTPVLPGAGTYEMLFAYNLPYDGKLDVELPVDHPTEVAVVFVSGENNDVESDLLSPSGSETLGEDVFQVLVADDVSPDEQIDVRISSPLFGGGGQALQSNWITIVLGVVGLALAGFGAWRFFAPVADDEDLVDDTDALIEEIIALDQAYESGELEEGEYLVQREALKSDLEALMSEEDTE